MSKWPVLNRLKRYLPSLPQQPAARIALAIGLSLLIHAIVLFGPLVELPKSEVPLPPLTAKLEPLPKIAAAPAPKKKPRPKPKAVESTAPAVQESLPETPSPEATGEQPQAVAEPQPAAEATEQAKPLLPKHAQLTFAVYQGSGGMQLGEAVHRLDIEEGQYTLKTVSQTTGVVSFFKSYTLTQTSRGRVDAQGLHPLAFDEEKKQSKGNQGLRAEFDWEAHKLHFSHGGEAALPEQAQDIASFLYQLSQMPMANRQTMPFSISNGKKLEYYELEIGAEEEIATPLGKLRALPLRKRHAQGEEGLDIWLGLEYRLLPVKVRQIDRTGQIAGEMAISDIRVSDE
ncbi:DUF3108 domain-containing protein [Ferrigenium kumadai]|uniref:DUF3108 domain-containing protein n=1 Tax=Ferrigenium kumadai TaxID=1682490 RepID=UPI001BB42A8E|nr:DUF3108 domain-containing protein [Ferrigenium kumadai]